MIVDCYIRAPNEAAFKAGIGALEVQTTHEDGSLMQSGRWGGFRFDLDAGFPIITTPGVYDEEGNTVSPPVYDPNWHVNLRCNAAVYERLGEVTRGTYQLPGKVEIFGAERVEDGEVLHGTPPATPQRVWF